MAVLPVRLLPSPKQRLEGLLDDSARHTLVLAMLQDVLAAASKATRIDRVLIVTPDAHLEHNLDLSQVEIIAADKDDLNRDLQAGLRQAVAAGAEAALIVLPDLPLLTGQTLDTLVRTAGRKGNVVIAGDWHGSGTNVLYLRPPNVMLPRFGTNSLTNHLTAAERAGLRVTRFFTEETALDIDDAEAVARFLRKATSSAAAQTTNTFGALAQLLKLPKDPRTWTKTLLNRATRRAKAKSVAAPKSGPPA
jgi:2-phospho-L-lactate guanylyltransferase